MSEAINNLGVYYDSKDYAGLIKRAWAWTIDSIVLGIFVISLWYLLSYMFDDEIIVIKLSFWTFVLFAYIYLSILKPSKLRTVGYVIAGLKIVDLYGNTPSWNIMLTRFFMLGFSPFAFIIDMLWLTGESTKQTLRDKYVGTYVIDNLAKPQGEIPLKKVFLNFLGWTLNYSEIGRDTKP